MKIRSARQEDVPAVVALYNLTKGISAATFDVKTVMNIFEKVQKHPNFHVYIAEKGAKVVGTFMLVVMEGPATGRSSHGIVENVAVHKRYQRQGIGKRMMEFAMEKCREVGCHELRFSTNDRNEEASRLFERLGFKQKGYGYVIDLDR
ncbi:MAG: GNAT family N-acetyltransferase [Candidatus Latescibacterota bacterium]|nr:MAG: GNAT family N-acetyltransferase [Candidatus Latescibacterota bacterium]